MASILDKCRIVVYKPIRSARFPSLRRGPAGIGWLASASSSLLTMYPARTASSPGDIGHASRSQGNRVEHRRAGAGARRTPAASSLARCNRQRRHRAAQHRAGDRGCAGFRQHPQPDAVQLFRADGRRRDLVPLSGRDRIPGRCGLLRARRIHRHHDAGRTIACGVARRSPRRWSNGLSSASRCSSAAIRSRCCCRTSRKKRCCSASPMSG